MRDTTGAAVAAGEVGEIRASARLMTTGYWREPELTAQTIVDGWLRTGDPGYLDADGFLDMVGRVKDLIVTGEPSTNVYSRTVEDAFNAHPQVHSSAGWACGPPTSPVPPAPRAADPGRARSASELDGRGTSG